MKAKQFILLLIFGFIIHNAFTQNFYIKDRINIKVGVSIYPPLLHNEKPVNIRIEMNYGFSRFLEAGAYLGYSKFYAYPFNGGNGYAPTPFYGVNSNLHILPLFVKQEDFRFDFYLTGKLGGNYYFTPDKKWRPARGHRTEYGIGLGLSFYLFKNLGLFTEYSLGRFSYFKQSFLLGPDYYATGVQKNLRFGLTFKYRNASHSKKK